MTMPNTDYKVTCDVCSVEKWADDVDFVPAHAAGSAQCDTTICDECINEETTP